MLKGRSEEVGIDVNAMSDTKRISSQPSYPVLTMHRFHDYWDPKTIK